ncbi:MAG TPA: hypothetical protein VGC65_00365 [Bacteroidia bacterium]|jgi:hypothetical protein
MAQKVTNNLTALLKFAEGVAFKIKGHGATYSYNKETEALLKKDVFYCDVVLLTESSFTVGVDLLGKPKKVRVFYDQLVFEEQKKK